MSGGADTVTLGNTTNFAATFGDSEVMERIERANWRYDMLRNRYRLQEKAGELLPDYRINFCNHTIPGKQREVVLDRETGKAHYKGIAKCGSVWACPVCAAKIGYERKQELESAIEKAQEKGLTLYFVTLTASHGRGDSAQELIDDLTAARRWMRKHYSFRKIKESIGYFGSVNGLEVTWGFKNGWHFHFHELFLAKKDLNPEEIEERLFGLWESALARRGLECSREHGVKVLKGDDNVAGYMTKWGLSNELAGAEKKEGHRGNYSPFELLALYDQGELWAGGLFQEYADATKGKTSLRYSRGLRDALGLSKEMSDQEAAERERERETATMFTFTKEQEQAVFYAGDATLWGDILAAAEGGRESLLHFLKFKFGIEPKPPP